VKSDIKGKTRDLKGKGVKGDKGGKRSNDEVNRQKILAQGSIKGKKGRKRM